MRDDKACEMTRQAKRQDSRGMGDTALSVAARRSEGGQQNGIERCAGVAVCTDEEMCTTRYCSVLTQASEGAAARARHSAFRRWICWKIRGLEALSVYLYVSIDIEFITDAAPYLWEEIREGREINCCVLEDMNESLVGVVVYGRRGEGARAATREYASLIHGRDREQYVDGEEWA